MIWVFITAPQTCSHVLRSPLLWLIMPILCWLTSPLTHPECLFFLGCANLYSQLSQSNQRRGFVALEVLHSACLSKRAKNINSI